MRPHDALDGKTPAEYLSTFSSAMERSVASTASACARSKGGRAGVPSLPRRRLSPLQLGAERQLRLDLQPLRDARNLTRQQSPTANPWAFPCGVTTEGVPSVAHQSRHGCDQVFNVIWLRTTVSRALAKTWHRRPERRPRLSMAMSGYGAGVCPRRVAAAPLLSAQKVGRDFRVIWLRTGVAVQGRLRGGRG
jgi:hypothetical protein